MELSIVLVIIGLVVGGIVVGQDLIRGAGIRSIITDIDKYKTAAYAFKTKYNCVPGDCVNATDFFGSRNSDNTVCQTILPTLASPTLTCNGNGDDKILDATEEVFLFWQHLANAGLIKGQYTGIRDGASVYHHVLGLNSPLSLINGTGVGFTYVDKSWPGDSGSYNISLSSFVGGNTFWVGTQSSDRPQKEAFTPTEALTIDKKIDDGKPAAGLVIMRTWTYTWGQADSCTTSTSNIDFNGNYNTSSKVISCALMIKSGI